MVLRSFGTPLDFATPRDSLSLSPIKVFQSCECFQQHQFTAPSVLVCAWVRRLNTEYLVPEFRRGFLSPDEHITRLIIGER